MNKYLLDLIQLSKYDRVIGEFEPKIKQEKDKLSTFVDVVVDIKSRIDEIYAQLEDAKSKKTKNNIHLAELKSKIEEIGKKHNSVQNEKELKALQLEEEISKEQVSFANEEIDRLDKIVEQKDEDLQKLKDELIQEEDSVKEIKTAVDEKIKLINEERNEVCEKRSKLLENFDNKILVFYEKIKRWAKTTAVSPVKKQACYGCHMKINDKVYCEVIRGEEIITCPHCGRILYKELMEETTEEETEKKA